MYQITVATLVDRYALMFTFSDGKRVLFDFLRFEGEFWFERVKKRFADYSTGVANNRDNQQLRWLTKRTGQQKTGLFLLPQH